MPVTVRRIEEILSGGDEGILVNQSEWPCQGDVQRRARTHHIEIICRTSIQTERE
jgi:hypothetical protein